VAADEPLIRIRDLRKRLSEKEVLRGLDLDVFPGQTLAVLGRSGGGKSVLLKHIIGLMKPDAGTVFVEGEDVTQLTERQLGAIRRKVSMLFQSAALFDSMTVAQNIAFPLREGGLKDPALLKARVAAALEMVDLKGTESSLPDSLSGGMRKRVGLARAIVGEPKCILYDEPTTGLDPIVSDSINRLIRRLQSRLRVTSIVVTHDMRSAFHVADQIAYLHEGRIYFKGTPDELHRATDPVIRNFVEGRSDEID
jgi:phospholipid/cholesterol/gamma-HCH transport system ATP-binding protein